MAGDPAKKLHHSCFHVGVGNLYLGYRLSIVATAKSLVHTFVISRVDYMYCNSVLVGAPKSTNGKLQRVLNSAAYLVIGTKVQPWLISSASLPPKLARCYRVSGVQARHDYALLSTT